MNEQERVWKQARYDELCAKDDSDVDLSDAELAEKTQLFYELYPEYQYWLSKTDQRTPQDIWHAY